MFKMSISWRSARVKDKEKRYKDLSTELPLKPFSVISFESLVMSTKKQRYFTKKEDNPKSKKLKTSQPANKGSVITEVKKLEEKVLKALDDPSSDNDSVVAVCGECEVDELYYNFLNINKFYCVNMEYRIAKSLHGVNNKLFEEKANSFLKYHFGLGINEKNYLTKIYNVGYENMYAYEMRPNEIMATWKAFGLSSHVKNNDCTILECGYVRETDLSLDELCTRNYLNQIAAHFKLKNAFAVVIANGTLCLNSVHIVPTKNLIVMETSDERYSAPVAQRNLINCSVIYDLLCSVHYKCKYTMAQFDKLINFSECCPMVIRANNENFELLQNLKGSVIDYAQTCDEPLNFIISFVLCYYERHHHIFNCSSVLITADVSFDLLELFRILCTLLNKIYFFVKTDHDTIENLFYSFLYKLPQFIPVRIGRDAMLNHAYKYCCLCDRTRICHMSLNPGVIDISNYSLFSSKILGISLDNLDISIEGSYGDEMVENLMFKDFQKRKHLGY